MLPGEPETDTAQLSTGDETAAAGPDATTGAGTNVQTGDGPDVQTSASFDVQTGDGPDVQTSAGSASMGGWRQTLC